MNSRVNQLLDRYLPSETQEPKTLHEAMRYAVLNGGKRLRPLLVYSAGEALGVNADLLDRAACAVEMIHAYSLIHDDLPAMDNDDMRRGIPTCHKAFGEATAILAGDALQTLAFQIVAEDEKLTPQQRVKMISCLARACGTFGMAGGQAMDLAVGQSIGIEELEMIHRYKTGCLIAVSIELAIIAANAEGTDEAKGLTRFADCFGLAFQIQDDIDDESVYCQLAGIHAAKEKVQLLQKEASIALEIFPNVEKSGLGFLCLNYFK